jgi:hypothetical protein
LSLVQGTGEVEPVAEVSSGKIERRYEGRRKMGKEI